MTGNAHTLIRTASVHSHHTPEGVATMTEQIEQTAQSTSRAPLPPNHGWNTAVTGGFRAYVRRGNAWTFGRSVYPGVAVIVEKTGEPDTDGWPRIAASRVPTGTDPQDWMSGRMDHIQRLQVTAYAIPGFHEERRPDVRNKIGTLGAYVYVWPEGDQFWAWVDEQVAKLAADLLVDAEGQR